VNEEEIALLEKDNLLEITKDINVTYWYNPIVNND
jgi:hypothetical protein